MERFFAENGLTTMEILHNNCRFYGDVALCGTRGWFYELDNQGTHNEKVLLREVGRLETSLKAAGDREKLCFLHYPPLYQGYQCPEILRLLGDDGMLIITADHGCDPGYLKHTDHTREYIPMIALGKKVKPVNLGTRAGFCDIAATVTELLGVPYQTPGRSFAAELV